MTCRAPPLLQRICDRLLPVQHLSERFHRLLPDADWVEIEGAGHLPQIDHPERVAELVLEVSSLRA